MEAPPGEVTLLLNELKGGNKDALGKLIPLVYQELRSLAAHYLRGERAGHTLQPTALVNELYVRLVNQDRANWTNRSHFLAVAAQLMRRILVDYARARQAAKRGGGTGEVDFATVDLGGNEVSVEEVLAVDEALERLAEVDPELKRVVELRYFAGLTVEETAEAVGTSPRSVKRDWALASAWLRTEFSRGPSV